MGTKISLKQLSDEILEKLNNGSGGNASLLREIVSNITVGAANSGTVFPEGQSLTDFAETILKREIAPIFTFSASNSGLKEKGTIINNSTLTMTITKQGTFKFEHVEFYKDNTLLDTQEIVDGTLSYTYNYNNQISTNTSFKAVIYYNNGTSQVTSNIIQFIFVNASYFGAVSDLNVTEGDIIGLNKSIKNTKTATYSNINMLDGRLCYAYPSSFGNLTSIKDGNNFEYINSYTKTVQTVNNENYNVYVLTDSVSVNNFKQIFS